MNINISISTQSYKVKPSDKEISKMQFTNTNISLEVFAELIKNGYNFTHQFTTINPTFSIKKKTKNNFKSTQIVCLDIDNGNKPFNEFISKLTYLPTISYTSPSYNAINEKYKFRLIYVFNDVITNPNEYESLYWCLVNQMNIDNEFTNDDNRVRNISYYLNGSFGCDMNNNFNQIYNIKDFNFVFQNNNDNYNSLYINLNDKKDTTTKLPKNTKLSKKFINDLNTLEPFKFIIKYKSVYPIFERTEVNFNDGFALLDEDYIQINRKWTWGSLETTNGLSKLYTITQKIKDGQGRRYHIGLAAMIRRKINPNVTLEHLIVNAVYDRLYYYDNSDGILTNQVLIERCCYVMNLKEITIKSYNKKRFMIDKKYWSEKGINANQAKNIVRKQLNYESIGSWYDCLKSVKENLIWAKENNIKVSMKTLYRFCKDNEVSTNPNKEVGKKVTTNKEYTEPIKDDRNLDLVNELNAMYQSNDFNFVIQNNNENNNIDYNNKNTNRTMEKQELLNKIDIMINKLSNTDDLDLLNTNYNKALEWVNRMFIKYDFNLDKKSIISEITSTYESKMNQFNKNKKGELLYRIQVANYNSNELYDLIKLLQAKIKTDFYINDLLIESNDDGYPWELIANKQIEFLVTAA